MFVRLLVALRWCTPMLSVQAGIVRAETFRGRRTFACDDIARFELPNPSTKYRWPLGSDRSTPQEPYGATIHLRDARKVHVFGQPIGMTWDDAFDILRSDQLVR